MKLTFNGTEGELIETGLNRIPFNFVTRRTTLSLIRSTRRADVYSVVNKSNREVGKIQIHNGVASEIFGNEVTNGR